MLIDVIIPTHKPEHLLGQCLESIQAAKVPDDAEIKILVCVNGNQRAGNSLLKKFEGSRLPVSWHNLSEKGKNHALNFGISRTRGDLIVCFDDDVLVSREYFVELIRGARRWPETPIYGGRVLLKWPSEHGELDERVIQYVRSYAFGAVDPQIEPGPHPSFQPIGNNMVLWRKAMPSMAPFNPHVGPRGASYVMGGGEGLFRALRSNGATFVYLPEALVFHVVRREQLSYRWLFRRSFAWGRSVAFYGNKFKKLDGKANVASFCWRYLVILTRLFRMSFKREKYPLIWSRVDLSILHGILFQRYWSKKTIQDTLG